ncbi:hypothetical protein [uncultured Brevundimonas sp.]|uniref:hypothetical protein n=1 Tax=uncultured Brevundimonas sp. TaxID=213418 RepID=UPI0030EC7CC4|tara:strand:- start:85720 stop:86334 length:615 start_codon:yes stop_codon:yes gene_type:complete
MTVDSTSEPKDPETAPPAKRFGWFHSATNIINLLLVTFTLGAVAAAFWQGSISRDVAKRQLRAYVFMDGGKLNWEQGAPTATLSINYKNTGATPAYKFRIGVTYMFESPDLQGALQVPGWEQTVGYTDLGPNSVLETSDPSIPMPQGETSSWITGSRHLYISTRIEYDDAFDEHHITTNRFRFIASQADGAVVVNQQALGSTSD